MPELPDVEHFRHYIEDNSLNQNIADVTVYKPRILENTDERTLKESLVGVSFTGTDRVGKNLFLKTSNRIVLVLHFGMTGFPRYLKQQEEEHKHTRMRIDFSNGYCFGFVNQRLLGRVSITEDIQGYLEQNHIGTDALSLDFESYEAALNRSRGAIKSVLMNQKNIAGIGNIYADEILFHAGIRPDRKSDDVSEGEKKALFDQIHSVLRTSIEFDADITKFPDAFIIPHRVEDDLCPVCSTTIEKIKISGRGTFFCPSCQN
jgi:formamidopyrimidine-DNA glycosylase